MSISLLKLSSGHFSLEFDEGDMPDVAKAIAELFGTTIQKRYAMASEVTFGGATFVFQNEWQDPCLISTSHRGDQCLQHIHERLTIK